MVFRDGGALHLPGQTSLAEMTEAADQIIIHIDKTQTVDDAIGRQIIVLGLVYLRNAAFIRFADRVYGPAQFVISFCPKTGKVIREPSAADGGR